MRRLSVRQSSLLIMFGLWAACMVVWVILVPRGLPGWWRVAGWLLPTASLWLFNWGRAVYLRWHGLGRLAYHAGDSLAHARVQERYSDAKVVQMHRTWRLPPRCGYALAVVDEEGRITQYRGLRLRQRGPDFDPGDGVPRSWERLLYRKDEVD